ncbi:hypothetical protein [Campylobacter molothri]|uniref:Uncharacterized protein n=1 Tax=Campylobacter molothri TaxID=1032242 RepID=A0ACC5W119_9BACT|nr:hypothetical protein [Campylobacter sp. RM9754]
MTSLNALKTGKEKLAIINQVLERISLVANALDNTRIEEIVGLKEQVNDFYNKILELKNIIVKQGNEISYNADFVENESSKIETISANIEKKSNEIKEIYSEINKIQNKINEILSSANEKYPKLLEFNQKFEAIQNELKNYYSVAQDFEAGLLDVEKNKNLVKEYLKLCINLKEQILEELEHAQDIKEDLHDSLNLVNNLVSNITATKNEIIAISNDFKNVKAEVCEIVCKAESSIKNKINTILFENQRLNQNMIEILKRCEKLEDEIVGKYEDIQKAINLINESKTMINDLNEAVETSREFANDMASYTQIVKDFKNQIDNLKVDLKSYNERLKSDLDLKSNEIKTNIDTKISQIELLKEQIQTLYENSKNTVDSALTNFLERAKIANEDLGRLLEVARVELANDKALIETYIQEQKENILKEMQKVADQITDETSGILAQKNAIEKTIIDAKVLLETLTQNFKTEFQEKTNDFNANATQKIKAVFDEGEAAIQKINDYTKEKESVFDGKVEAIENATTQGIKDIENSKTQSVEEIENTSQQSIEAIEQKTQENTQIFEKLIQNNLGGIYSHLFSLEKVLIDKEIIKLSYKE